MPTTSHPVQHLAPAPLDAVNVFFGGDVWHSLTTQVGGTPFIKVQQAPYTPHIAQTYSF